MITTAYKSCFYPDHRHTPEAQMITLDIKKTIRPILEELIAKGYSIRELSHIATLAIMDLEAEIALEYMYTKAKHDRSIR